MPPAEARAEPVPGVEVAAARPASRGGKKPMVAGIECGGELTPEALRGTERRTGTGRRITQLVAVLAVAAGCASAPPRPIDVLSAEEHNDLGVAYYREGDFAS